MKKIIVPLLLAYGLWMSNVHASPFSGNIDAGFMSSNGNTQTRDINFKSTLNYQKHPWDHLLTIEAINTSSNDTTTSERYLLGEKSNYELNHFSSLFTRFESEKDRFIGYDYRYSLVMGYNRILLDRKNFKLNAGIGPGYRQTRIESKGIDREIIAQLSTDMAWEISKPAKLTEALLSESGNRSGTMLRSETELTLTVVGNLATKIGYRLTYFTEVPAANKKLDTETTLSLSYSF